MPRHALKLLVLSAAFAVAPATAGHRIGPASNHSSDSACPHERARLAAALAAQNQAAQAPKVATRITLTEGVPSERPLRNVAPGAFFTP